MNKKQKEIQDKLRQKYNYLFLSLIVSPILLILIGDGIELLPEIKYVTMTFAIMGLIVMLALFILIIISFAYIHFGLLYHIFHRSKIIWRVIHLIGWMFIGFIYNSLYYYFSLRKALKTEELKYLNNDIKTR